MKGRWAKNSSTFSIDDIGTATLGTGGTFTVDPKTNLKPFTGKVAGTLTGSGLPTGTAIWVEIHCWHSYPPLKFGCEIIIHSGPPPTGAPHRSVDAAPQMTTGSTPLCKATGTKPLGNTGVVNVTLKNSNSAGAADICTGKITGKWKKNSTSFSWATSGPVTLGAGGTFRALSGPVMGPAGKATGTLTGSGLPAGSNITVDAGCQITYPPLKIRCWIIVSAA